MGKADFPGRAHSLVSSRVRFVDRIRLQTLFRYFSHILFPEKERRRKVREVCPLASLNAAPWRSSDTHFSVSTLG